MTRTDGADGAAHIAARLSEAFGWDADRIADLAASVEARHLDGGAVLVTAGDASDAVYVLLDGRLAVEDARGGLLGEVRPGETVGETGVLTGEPRNATVRAVRAASVARIAAENFMGLVERHPDLGLAMARTMIMRQRRAARPRHPAILPDVVCVVPLEGGPDAAARTAAFVAALEASGAAPLRVAKPGAGAQPGDGIALSIADPADPERAAAALRSADEIVMLGRIGDDAKPGRSDELMDRVLPATALPRRSLVLTRGDGERPVGTAAWLDARRVDRHLHVRPDIPADIRRTARVLSGRAVGLVLAGGGARGAAHLGAIRALTEAGVEPDFVGGTSIGAAMAAWYAMGLRGEALEDAAREVFVAHGSPTGDWTALPLVSLVKGEKTRRLCRSAVRAAIGFDADIEDIQHPYFAIAADLTRQRQAVLTRGPLHKALSATYAIPGILPPVVVDGALHVDGGVVNNLPVDVMERFDAAQVIAVDLLPDPSRPVELDVMPTGGQVLRDRLRRRTSRRYRVPGILTTLLTSTVLGSLERQRSMRERADLLLRPDLPRVGLLDWSKFDRAIEAGYQSCAAQIAATDPDLLASLRA